jgi:hypothetical protein
MQVKYSRIKGDRAKGRRCHVMFFFFLSSVVYENGTTARASQERARYENRKMKRENSAGSTVKNDRAMC